jgi:SH3 domain protein
MPPFSVAPWQENFYYLGHIASQIFMFKGFIVKKLLILLMLSLMAPSLMARDYYVADKLFTYMHSGPNNKYRIIGSVAAGDKVQVLQNNQETGYSEIVDSRGRKGWIEQKFITTTESMASRLPRLEQELADVKALLANAKKKSDQEKAGLAESLDIRNKQISELESNYTDISQKLTAAQGEIRQLRAKLDTQKEDLLMKYFTYGGGVAFGGILFGLILPHLIPKKKKSRSDWI